MDAYEILAKRSRLVGSADLLRRLAEEWAIRSVPGAAVALRTAATAVDELADEYWQRYQATPESRLRPPPHAAATWTGD